MQVDLSLRHCLFNFTDPGKIDLEEFMCKNFMFNVSLETFAKMTGRSLSTFKRDFGKVFNSSPSRWLKKKRLEHAHYLIKVKRKTPSDVYLEVGFENLSHFSSSFKEAYGYNPSALFDP
jgi:AraC-like DNA-binding protein